MDKHRRRAPDWLALGLLLFAAGLRFWTLGGPSFWYDEAYSWWVGTQVTAAESLASSLNEFIPPGAYFLWRAWAALVGTSEFALRAISAFSGLIAVAAAGRAAALLEGRPRRELRDRRLTAPSPLHTGLFFAAIAPPLLWASRELRMYGPLMAFILLGTVALLEVVLGSPRRRRAWAWLWGGMALAALYTVVLSGAWLIGLGAFFLAVLALASPASQTLGSSENLRFFSRSTTSTPGTSPTPLTRAEPGAAQTGSGTAQTGSGTAQTGSGTAETGSGTAQTGSGTAQTGSASVTRLAHGARGKNLRFWEEPKVWGRAGLIHALVPPALVAALLYLPWLIPALRHLGANRGYWAGTLPLPAFFARTLQGITVFRATRSEITAQRVGAAIAAFAVVAPALTMPVLVSERARRAWRLGGPVLLRTPLPPSGHRPLPRHLLPALFTLTSLLPPLLLMGLAVRSLPKWNLQHTVIFAPPLYLALGTVAARLLRPWGRRGPQSPIANPHLRRPRLWKVAGLWLLRLTLLGITVVLATSSYNLLTHPALANDDWRGLTRYIREQRAPGELVIIRAGWALPAWRYYQSRAGAPAQQGGPCCEGIVPLPNDPLLDVTHVLNYANTAPVLSAHLPGASGAWVIDYLAHVSDPTNIVGTLLEDVSVRDGAVSVERALPGFQGLDLHHYTFNPAPLPAGFSFPEEPVLHAPPGHRTAAGPAALGLHAPGRRRTYRSGHSRHGPPRRPAPSYPHLVDDRGPRRT